MEKHVDSEINSIAESTVDAHPTLIDGGHASELQEYIDNHQSGNKKCRVPPSLPINFIENRTDNKKECSQMKERDKSFHALEITPETFYNINTKNRRKTDSS